MLIGSIIAIIGIYFVVPTGHSSSLLEPFVAMIMGLILLYRPITGAEILGSLFIVGGGGLSTFQRTRLNSDT